MSIFSRKRNVPLREDLKKPLAWAALALALSASFAAGYLLGHEDSPTPIVIEKISELE